MSNKLNQHKIIFSRKGFDSSAGAVDSPVINNQFISLPIPEGGSSLFYHQLKLHGSGLDFFSIIRQLGAKQFSECHMDPVLNPSVYGLDEKDGWSPAFGQDDIALIHLLKQNVKKGDIFLFFGRFKHANISGDSIKYMKDKEFHAIYGFMEIGEIINIKTQLTAAQKKIYKNHPHVKIPEY